MDGWPLTPKQIQAFEEAGFRVRLFFYGEVNGEIQYGRPVNLAERGIFREPNCFDLCPRNDVDNPIPPSSFSGTIHSRASWFWSYEEALEEIVDRKIKGEL